MTTVPSQTSSGGYEYAQKIHLTESAGESATITGITFTLMQNGAAYGQSRTIAEAQAWSGGTTVLAANGSLSSQVITLTDEEPQRYADRIEARITYSDASSTSQSLTLSASVPSLPGPPPNTKFTLTGTVKDASSGSTLRDVKIEVRDGGSAGRNTKTDRNGKYSLADLKAGSFTVRASKSDYASSELAVINSNKVLNFSLRKSGGGGGGGDDDDDDGGGGGGGGGSSLTCNGASVPSVVDCLNDQGRKAPTAKCDDGAYSCSQNRSGTCSHHGGVKCWVCPGPLCEGGLASELSTADSTVDSTPEWLQPAGPPQRLQVTIR